MIIGASLGGFVGLTFEQAIEVYLKLSDELELNAVEIRFEKEHGRPSLWRWEVNSKTRKFLERFEVVGAHLPFIYINPFSPNQRIREESVEQLKGAMRKTAELGMTYTVMHARGLALGLSDKEQFEEWHRLIRELTSYAKENSILLNIENADFLWNLADVAKIVRKINSKWLRMAFDVGHAHLRKVPPLQRYPVKELFLRSLDAFLPFLFPFKKNMPYEKYGSIENFIRAEKELMHVVHVHDYNGRRDHLELGRGKIDFSFLSELKENFKGPYILEVEFNNHYEDFKRNYEKFMKLVEL